MRKCYLLLISFVVLVSSINIVYGSNNELEKINKAILDNKAKWVAGENWVTRLSPEERKRLCGSFLGPQDPESATLFEIPKIENLPQFLDWRDNNGNWVTPPKNQFSCGSCWDFAAVGHVEAWWKIKNENPDSMIDLSEQFILSCTAGSCDGWWPEGALTHIQNFGIPTESCFQYTGNDQLPCSNACDNWEDEAIKIPGWSYVTLDEDDVETIKSALYHQPLAACFIVYEDFNYYESGVYEHVWGNYEGGHCILIVGWNDEEQSWICKNSWGLSWGASGYFRIKWHNCGMGTYIPFIWDETTTESAFAVSPKHFDISLTYGDSITYDLTVKNQGPQTLQFSSIDFETQVKFHTDDYQAWDGFSWWCADPNLNGYGDSWLQLLNTPVLDISNSVNPKLTFMANWSVENPSDADPPYDGWDGINVWISVDGGNNYNILLPTTPAYTCQSLFSFGDAEEGWHMGTGVPGWAGTSNGWQTVEFDLSSYQSEDVVIQFVLASDQYVSAQTNPQLFGMIIDDIIVADDQATIFEDYGDDLSNMKRSALGPRMTADWLRVTNIVNNVQAFDSVDVGITVNTRTMIPGFYSGLIQFTSNNSTTPTDEVFFGLEVLTPAHDIGIDQAWLPADTITLFSTNDLNVQIKNYGENDETNFNVICSLLNDGFPIHSDTSFVTLLQPGATNYIQFESFYALQIGEMECRITIENLQNDYNDYNNQVRRMITITNLVDDFEFDSRFWEMENGWGITSELKGHNSDFAAHVNNGTTPYLDNMDALLTYSPGFDVHGVEKATLKFWTRFNTEKDVDICYVEISGDNTNWIKADSLSGSSPAWKQREIGLTNLIDAGYSQIWVRFHFITNESDTRFGVLIDDVEIYHQYPTEIQDYKITETTPLTWSLQQNYPNPFNLSTTMNYSLPQAGRVKITIFNINGQIVRELLNSHQTAGYYTINWDGYDNLSNPVVSGIYFYVIEAAEQFSSTKKMILLK